METKLEDVTPETPFWVAANLVLAGRDRNARAYQNTFKNVLGAAPKLAERPLRDIQDADVRAALNPQPVMYRYPKSWRGIYVRVYNSLAYDGLIPSDMSDLSRSAHRELQKMGHLRERRDRLVAEREAQRSPVAALGMTMQEAAEAQELVEREGLDG